MIKIIILLVFLALTQPYSWAATPPSGCDLFFSQITEKLEGQKKLESNLAILINKSGTPSAPVNTLFSKSFSILEESKLAINELRKDSIKTKLPLLDDKINSHCFEQENIKKSIDELTAINIKNNSMKISFLGLDQEKKEELIAVYNSKLKQVPQSLPLNNQLQESYVELEKSKSDSQDTSLRAAAAEDLSLKQVLESKLVIENKLIEIEKEQVELLKDLSQSNDVISNLEKDLVKLETYYQEEKNLDLKEVYTKSIYYWRVSADELFHLYNDFSLKIDESLPELLYLQTETEEEKSLYNEYKLVYEKIKNRRKEIVNLRLKLISDLKAKNYRSLNDAGNLRSKLIHECTKAECDKQPIFSEENIQDLLREIKLVPLKISSGVLSKILEFRLKFTIGLEGWIDFSSQAFYLFLILLIPFFLNKSLKILTEKLELIKKNLFSKSMMNFKKRTLIAKWITRLNPFIPYIGMLSALFIAEKIIINTDLKELIVFFYYIELFYFYKITRLVLTVFLELLFLTNSIDRLKINKDLAFNSATRISRIIFIELFLLHITEDSVRRAFTYSIISQIILIFNIIGIFVESNRWKKEILESFKNKFKNAYTFTIEKIPANYVFFLLPFLLLTLVINEIFSFISSYLIKLDSVKRLMTEILRKKIELIDNKARKDNNPPPKEYLDYFDYYLPATESIVVNREVSILKKSQKIINSWLANESQEDLLILVGNRGMGKSTTLDCLKRDFSKTTDLHFSKIDNKILNSEELFIWLSELLSTPITCIRDIRLFDKQLSYKKMILIDDIQNLFLSSLNGFEAYKIFLEILNIKTNNILWILSVNSESWIYLKSVFGQEHFYGKELFLIPWKDYEIQNLIHLRHKQTGYERDFDESIKAFGSSDNSWDKAEVQFFRLLWGQARGNPRSALMYWVSAVSYPKDKTIHIEFPTFLSTDLVSNMSDDALFILAAIAKHDNLSLDELQQVTCISNLIIRKCLKEAYDKSLIWMDENERIRISSRAQYLIDYFLKGKNFL